MTLVERGDDLPRVARARPHHDPPASRIGARFGELALKVVRVVDRDAVDLLAACEQRIPGVFHARPVAAADVVHGGMPVEDLEQPVVLHAEERGGVDAPEKIRMVDVRHRAFGADRIDRFLHGAQQRAVAWRGNHAGDAQRIHVDGGFLEPGRDLFAGDQQKRRVHQRRQRGRVGEDVVIGEHQEVVFPVLVPARDLLGRGVAVGVGGVRVRVAFKPAGAGRGLGHEEARGLGGECGGQSGQCEGQREHARHSKRNHEIKSATEVARPRDGYGFVTTTWGAGDAAVSG